MQLADVRAISAGTGHTCAIHGRRALSCWGNNTHGRLGDGTPTTRSAPVPVVDMIDSVTAVSAGANHTCAVRAGAAYCWGANPAGQLGDGSISNSITPVRVTGLTSGVTAISASNSHTCAIHNGGAKCWGDARNGQLGMGTPIDAPAPVQVVGLDSGVTAIATGVNHTCALHNGGAKCWGNNNALQLGDGSNSPRNTPVQVAGLDSGVTAISAARSGLLTCAVHHGAAKCWGPNQRSQLGDGTTLPLSGIPVQVVGLTSDVTALALGHAHSCAVHAGAVKCWGENSHGQLGDGNTTTSAQELGLPLTVQLP